MTRAQARVGHLFAGAGGGLLASLMLGHENVFAVEVKHFPAEVLRQRAAEGWFPGLRIHEQDCREFDPAEYAGRVDAIHAGWPCQDISCAGHGAGIGGAKSGLWSEVVRIARILRPGELFLENSAAITVRGLGRVLGDLVGLGYDSRWCVLSAAAVGAGQLRPRWWCLATLPDDDRKRSQTGRRPRGYEAAHSASSCTDSARDQAGPAVGGEVYGLAGSLDGLRMPGWITAEESGKVDAIQRLDALGNGQYPMQAAVAYVLLKGETQEWMR